MFLYKLIKPYTTLGVKTFFKKVYFHNDYHIPKDKPVLITCNHPTAFLDPVIMACMLKTPIHFMVRGDVFKKPFYRKILESLNMIPIFRFKDGFSNLKNNQDSLDKVSDLLAANQHVLIFAEGGCTQEKRLRPIQKGTARMAFGAIEKHGDLDIYIVPAGVNYSLRSQVRDTVKFEFGAPIRLADYKAMYAENTNKAIKALTEDIETRMRKLVVHIDDEEDRVAVDYIQEIMTNNIDAPQFPIKDRDIVPLRYDRLIANTFNEMEATKKTAIKHEILSYFNQLDALGVTDYGVLHRRKANFLAVFNLIFGFLPNLIGMILGNPFWSYGKRVAKKKVKHIEFFSSVWFGVCFFSFLLFLLLWVIAALVIQKLIFTLFVVLIPYFCFFYITYQDYFHSIKQAWKAKQLSATQLQSFLQKRKELVEAVLGK